MTLRVTNTLSGEKEAFEPRDSDSVLLYYCGLTTSDPPHLGHARGWVHVDVMHRWLEWLGYEVRHVENFTDVNEKIVARVGEAGESEADVARTYIQDVIRDMRSLNLKRADVYPRVSEHVPEIIDLVETLIDRGYAYETNGSVYFDVTEFEDYGTLSNQTVEELDAQGDPEERGEKRHPQDFALWKADGVAPEDIEEHQHPEAASADDACQTAQTWDSPWGEGRPGWHVECSAMSMTHLDETLDIHVGGQDLVFPHHENEVAQSEAATGQPFANYWLHVGLLETKAEKMSSSLGNFATVEEAIAAYGPGVVRTFLLSTAYHSRATYSDKTLTEAEDRFERLKRGYERALKAADSVDAGTKVEADALREAIEDTREAVPEAMNDDFNTREALAALEELTNAVNRHVDEREVADYRGLRRAIETYEAFGVEVLGLPLGETGGDGGDVRLAEDLVELVLDVREAEREAGNYERADDLRDELAALGVEVQDSDDGPTYRLP
ncbi:cysteine--tRNA ligase [Halorhabdus sp. CBA1104]|uniref:cysteine--tRNA ligase n=1 Tax=unclassified Halorhabdus TaxID=2621901 RepID=UPI0012B40B50|nr:MULTISPECIES: cysteine--tRNA ligase [unclassified Halorhabdus]QGN06404.1 cysteine--tRNA ligase [Halorhabdus sp. CBA1104]